MVGVPCLTRWVPGPSSRICLPMPSQRSSRRNGGMRMTMQAKASSSPWMNSTPCSFTEPPHRTGAILPARRSRQSSPRTLLAEMRRGRGRHAAS